MKTISQVCKPIVSRTAEQTAEQFTKEKRHAVDALKQARDLIQEIIDSHRADTFFYDCDAGPCAWCAEAKQWLAALNNRRSNLRIAGKKQNGYNRRKTLSRKAASFWNV